MCPQEVYVSFNSFYLIHLRLSWNEWSRIHSFVHLFIHSFIHLSIHPFNWVWNCLGLKSLFAHGHTVPHFMEAILVDRSNVEQLTLFDESKNRQMVINLPFITGHIYTYIFDSVELNNIELKLKWTELNWTVLAPVACIIIGNWSSAINTRALWNARIALASHSWEMNSLHRVRESKHWLNNCCNDTTTTNSTVYLSSLIYGRSVSICIFIWWCKCRSLPINRSTIWYIDRVPPLFTLHSSSSSTTKGTWPFGCFFFWLVYIEFHITINDWCTNPISIDLDIGIYWFIYFY